MCGPIVKNTAFLKMVCVCYSVGRWVSLHHFDQFAGVSWCGFDPTHEQSLLQLPAELPGGPCSGNSERRRLPSPHTTCKTQTCVQM